MWSLNLPDSGNTIDDLNVALQPEGSPPLYALNVVEIAAIAALYHTYDQLGGQPSPALTPPSLGDACLSAVHSAFGQVQAGGRLRKLRDRLMLMVEQCPYCGFGEVTDLDHYLPKSIYKALSVYPRNLIPSCSRCNRAKHAHVPETQSQGMIYAYFAQIPQVRFFVANVDFSGNALTVNFKIESTNIDAKLAQSLNFQLTRLKLNERYPKQINTFLFGLRTGLTELIETKDSALLSEFLRRSALDMEDSFGMNDWRSALLFGLSASSQFCDGGAKAYFATRTQSAQPTLGLPQAV